MNIWPFSELKRLRQLAAELKASRDYLSQEHEVAFNQSQRRLSAVTAAVDKLKNQREWIDDLQKSHTITTTRLSETITKLEADLENANDRAFRASEAHVITMGKFNQALDSLKNLIKSPKAGDDGTEFRNAIHEAEGFYNSHRSTKNCIHCGSKMIELRGEDKKLCSNGACGHEVDWPLEEGQTYMYKRDVEPFIEDRSGAQENLPPLERL